MKNHSRVIELKGVKTKISYQWVKGGIIVLGKFYEATLEPKEIICRNGSNGRVIYVTYNGVRFPDNDKKLLEMILN